MKRISSAGSGDSSIDVSESIDQYGNRNGQSGTLNESFTTAAGTTTNQITTSGFTYDPTGRLTQGTFGSVYSARTFSWDPAGQIQTYSEGGILVDCYEYDPFGRRIADIHASSGSCSTPSSTTYFVYGSNDGGHPLAEYAGSWQTGVQDGSGNTFATVNAGGSADYLAVDAVVGTERQAVDSSGTAGAPNTVYPYGEVGSGSTSEDFYTNQARDANGLDHFWYRTYSSNLARWLSPDPGGLAVVHPGNPQTWNRYAYTANDPASRIDPLGLEWLIVCEEDAQEAVQLDSTQSLGGPRVNKRDDNCSYTWDEPLPVTGDDDDNQIDCDGAPCSNDPGNGTGDSSGGGNDSFSTVLNNAINKAKSELQKKNCAAFFGGIGLSTLDSLLAHGQISFSGADFNASDKGGQTQMDPSKPVSTAWIVMNNNKDVEFMKPVEKSYTLSAGQIQATEILHELAHVLSSKTGFTADAGNPAASQANTDRLLGSCPY